MARPSPNTAVSANHVLQLLPKLEHDDPDFRFMALSDMRDNFENAQPGFLGTDYITSARVVDGLVLTLKDTNGDVQNMAVKCLGPFVNKASLGVLCPMLERLSNIKTDNDSDQTIPSLALREVVTRLARPVPGVPRTDMVNNSYSAISRVVIPRLVGYNVFPPKELGLPEPPKGMIQADLDRGIDSNTMDLLNEVARCFGPMLQEPEVQALEKATLEVLESDRAGSMMKKKAVTAISTLATYISDALLSSLLSRIIEHLRDVHLTASKRKLYITILGSLARSIPRKFGPYIKTLCPFVVNALGTAEVDEAMESGDEDERDTEVDDVLEAALIALDSFLASCSQDMRFYTTETIEAATRLLKYDPNLASNDDDDDDDDDAMSDRNDFEDEDFEEETGFDDDDDGSWKVRRCAAKVLYTLVSTRSAGDLLEDGTLYERIAPQLIARFKEREESVLLEVLAALSNLVKASRESGGPLPGVNAAPNQGSMGPPPSRKRRRGGSDASMFDIPTNTSLSSGYQSPAPAVTPQEGPRASLSRLTPDIIQGVSQLLKSPTSQPATKQASIILLNDIVLTQHGGLDQYLSQILGPVIQASKSTAQGATSNASATANSLRIHALQLIGSVADTHSSKSIQPYLDDIVPALVYGIKERYSKLSTEALVASEKVIQALTPPRAATSGQANSKHLETLYEALVAKGTANDADLEVRQAAIHAIGLIIGRSSGTQGLLSSQKRTDGLNLLLDRLKNEVTRTASVHAIEVVALHTKAENELSQSWVCSVALELAAQLRKASRVLRGSSLSALRTLALNPISRKLMDKTTRSQVIEMLVQILDPSDLHLLGPALVVLATFVKDDKTVVTSEFNAAVCRVASGSLSGSSLDALLKLVRVIGESGAGASLMRSLLSDVGIDGNPEVLGKVEGNLLVYGGPSVGVTADQFVQELETATDSRRKSLALAVLGEVGLRKGSQSTLSPELFIKYFNVKSEEVPLAAAVALGRAGAGNISTYLPAILSAMGKPSSKQYLLLHAVKEILQQDNTESEIIPYANSLWQNLIAASQLEDNKAIGAECIGRLVIVDPKTYIPQLETFLRDRNSAVRAMVISALRYTLSDTDQAFDEYLRPVVIPMLIQMLQDPELDNRRIALTTLNSALHNKPHIITPALDQLLPLALKETEIKHELIREVMMGPFKHVIDDGLEERKAAYETIYALLETTFSRLSPLDASDCFDHILAGIKDNDDIRILCSLMLTKLMVLAPDQTRARLQPMAESFRAVLCTTPKKEAVKQEIEKLEEAWIGVIKVSIEIQRQIASTSSVEDAQTKSWSDYWAWLGESPVQTQFKTVYNRMKVNA